MFDIGSSEFLLIVIVAVVVIGPKDLPRALYKVGQVVGKARAMARHFRTGIDAMVREVELEELEKKWAAQNERIMREHAGDHPPLSGDAAADAALPPPEGAPAAQADAPPATAFVPIAPPPPAASVAESQDGAAA
jgi:sec-independent protein translocase protein TatB